MTEEERIFMEEKLNIYYKKIAKIILKYREIATNFIDQAAVALYKGYEEGNLYYQEANFYERLMLVEIFNKTQSLEPFLEIDDNYYIDLLNEYLEDSEDMMKRLMEIDLLIERLHKGDETLPKELVSLYKAFHNLSRINRAGWVRSGVMEDYQENDAEHTMQMMLFASAFLRCMKSELDASVILTTLLIHEIGENKAGDVIDDGSIAHQNKGKMEEEYVKFLFSNLSYGEKLITLWSDFEHKRTEEGIFCYKVDKLDAVLKAGVLDEVSNVHTLFEEFAGFETDRKMFDGSVLESVFLKAKEMNGQRIIK